MKEKVVTEKQLNKHLFLYKSPLYKNIKFKIISGSKESNDLVTGLNIKIGELVLNMYLINAVNI